MTFFFILFLVSFLFFMSPINHIVLLMHFYDCLSVIMFCMDLF